MKELISDFLEGYQVYTNVMKENKETAKSIIGEVFNNAENWLEQ